MTVNLTYEQMDVLRTELEQFKRIFPNTYMIISGGRVDNFFAKNRVQLGLLNEKNAALWDANICKDADNNYEAIIEEPKIIVAEGQPKPEPVRKWKFKSPEHEKAFNEGIEELKKTMVKIEI